MKNLTIKNFRKDPAGRLLDKAILAHSQITANAATFATPNPSMAALKTLIDELNAAIIAAGSKDIYKVARLKNKRTEMVNFLQRVGMYVDMVADGVRLVALLSGMGVRKIPAMRTLVRPKPPRVSRTAALGSITASCGEQEAARSFCWHISPDSTLPLEQWKMVVGTSRVTLTDCTPGLAYYVCAVAVGFRNQRAESPVVKVVA